MGILPRVPGAQKSVCAVQAVFTLWKEALPKWDVFNLMNKLAFVADKCLNNT